MNHQIVKRIRSIPYRLMASVFIGAFVALGIMVMNGTTTAQADASDNALISNIGYGGTLLSSQTAYDYAQAFRTGTNPNGYTLDNLQIVFENATANVNNVIMSPRIELHRVDSSGEWQPMAAWLDEDRGTPKRTTEFIYTYNASFDMEKLQPNTTYWITVARSSSMSLSLTKWTNHDATSSIGWSMPGGVSVRGNSFDYSDAEGNNRMRLRLNGINPAYIDFTGSTYPKYASLYGGIRPLCEWIGNGYFTCEEDENGDIVTYIPEHLGSGIRAHWYLIVDEDYDMDLEENAGKFRHWIEGGVDPVSGLQAVAPYSFTGDGEQKLITLVTFDYEVKNRYDMVLKVHDVEDDITASYDFVIHVSDRDDHPGRITDGPAMGTAKIARTTAGRRDVDICWASPWNGGRPPITGYDMRYRIVADPQLDWTSLGSVITTDCRNADGDLVNLNPDGIGGITTLGYRLTDLEPNTNYEFDVRAHNAQLTGAWTEHSTTFNIGGVSATQTALAPLTAHTQNQPAEHDGSQAFTFELLFSENIPNLEGATLKDSTIQISGGQITGVERVNTGSNQHWRATVRPTGTAAVNITIPSTTDCQSAGAICVDARMLANAVAIIVLGPPPEPEPVTPTLTAEFREVPNGHNGSDVFKVELHFSEDIPDLSYRTVRDSMLTVTNGQITKATRITQGSNEGWNVTVRPTVSERVTILLSETTDCAVAGAVCVDGMKLTGDITAVIEAQ